jgi:hypothetical protein
MTNTTYTANFKGQQVFVGETVRGWITITMADGTSAKARAKDLTDIREVKISLSCDDQGNETVEVSGERKNGVVKASYLGRYHKVKLDNGAVVRDNGDDAAVMVRGLEQWELFNLVSEKLGVTVASLEQQYGHLNSGMVKMNCTNRLRKALRQQAAANTGL